VVVTALSLVLNTPGRLLDDITHPHATYDITKYEYTRTNVTPMNAMRRIFGEQTGQMDAVLLSTSILFGIR
jgi:hypothetical protein